jgi:uncharacterized RDD family membrane protein YckC
MSYRYYASTNVWQPPFEASAELRAAAFMIDAFLVVLIWFGLTLLPIEPRIYLSVCFILIALISPGKRMFRLRIVRIVDGSDAAMTKKACHRILALFSVPLILITAPIRLYVEHAYRPFYDQFLDCC